MRNSSGSLLKFVASAGQSNRKAAKRRIVWGNREHFEPLSNAASPSAAEFQHTANLNRLSTITISHVFSRPFFCRIFSRQMAILDRPRRHLHRHRRKKARWFPRNPQAAFGKSRAVPRRGAGRNSPSAGRGKRRAHPGRGHRSRQDGHYGGHQCAARAQGRAHRVVHHARIPRRVAHRLPEPAAYFRQAHHAARTALHESRGSRGARRGAR